MRKIAFIAVFLMISGVCYGERVYVRDKNITIPVKIERGEVKQVINRDGSQTWLYNYGYKMNIVHPDGTTTSIYNMDINEN